MSCNSSYQIFPYFFLDSSPAIQRVLCRCPQLPIYIIFFTLLMVIDSCAVQAASVVGPQLNVNRVEQQLDTILTSTLSSVQVTTRTDPMLKSSTNQPITSSTDAFYNLLNLPRKSSLNQTLFDGAVETDASQVVDRNSIWSNSVTVLISQQSWKAYTKFKQDTCRTSQETSIAERPLNSTESGYFTWEERMFHQELRKIILPETKDGSYRSIAGSPLLRSLQPKIFASIQGSLCRPQSRDFEQEARNAQDSHSFEDFLIDRVVVSRFTIRRYTNSKGITAGSNTSLSVSLSPLAVEKPKLT